MCEVEGVHSPAGILNGHRQPTGNSEGYEKDRMKVGQVGGANRKEDVLILTSFSDRKYGSSAFVQFGGPGALSRPQVRHAHSTTTDRDAESQERTESQRSISLVQRCPRLSRKTAF